MKKLTTEEFISKAKELYNDEYDYSKVNYINSSTKIIIICKEHGEFYMTPNNFLRGKRCRKCANNNISKNKRLSTTQYIDKVKKNRNDFNKYDYSKVNYVNGHHKICIICKEHGEFWQDPYSHLNGANCPKCMNKTFYTTNSFIDYCKKEFYDYNFDYSKVKYINMHEKVEIICEKHGSFFVTPSNFIDKQSRCPKCSHDYKGERRIRNFLLKNNIVFEEQKTFDECTYKKKLRFDFYIPSKNLCIEYDGIGHFEPVNWNHKMSLNDANKIFENG